MVGKERISPGVVLPQRLCIAGTLLAVILASVTCIDTNFSTDCAGIGSQLIPLFTYALVSIDSSVARHPMLIGADAGRSDTRFNARNSGHLLSPA
jgi:hypothetical protein